MSERPFDRVPATEENEGGIAIRRVGAHGARSMSKRRRMKAMTETGAQTATTAPIATVEPPPAPPTGRGRILVVDDDLQVLEITRLWLEHEGYEVDTEARPETAIDLFRDRSSTYVGVVLDLAMPRLAGDRLWSCPDTVCPGIPTVFVSGHAYDDVHERIPRSATVAFVQKPWTLATMRAAFASAGIP